MGRINNKVIRGTFGRVWMNNEQVANVKSFEAKVTLDYEDIHVNGEFGVQKRYMGYSIAGTMTIHKIGSEVLRLYGSGMMNGQDLLQKPSQLRHVLRACSSDFHRDPSPGFAHHKYTAFSEKEKWDKIGFLMRYFRRING